MQDLINEAASDPAVSRWPVAASQSALAELGAEWRGSLILTFDCKIFAVRNTRVFDAAQSGQLWLWLQWWGTASCKLYDAWWMVQNAKAAALGVIHHPGESNGARADRTG